MSDSKKYQLTCPKCKHEFTYDNGYLDKNITRLGQEIHEITLKLTEFKLLPYPEQKKRIEWKRRASVALNEKRKEISELKAIRKVADQQINQYKFQVFANLVKDFVGEEQYRKLLDKVDEELIAYKASGLARHEYTRSNAKTGVTSINKL